MVALFYFMDRENDQSLHSYTRGRGVFLDSCESQGGGTQRPPNYMVPLPTLIMYETQ